MSDQRVSVRELLKNWEYRETVKFGGVIKHTIKSHQMPTWNDICSELNWQLYAIDERAFGKKIAGMAVSTGCSDLPLIMM
jgi:hypothetical protein